jgi:hypothetical protein
MKRRHWILPILIFLLHYSAALEAQQEKVVLLSPLLGTEIDREERDRFAVFQSVRDFSSVEVRHRGDSSFLLLFRLGDDVRGYRDSSAQISQREVVYLAEKIHYHDEVMSGRHRTGSAEVALSYADGSHVVMKNDAVMLELSSGTFDAKAEEVHTMPPQPTKPGNRSGLLPLAKNKHGLQRPRFKTFDFALSLDVMSMDIRDIESLPGDKGRSTVSVTMRLGIHVLEEHPLRLLGGWTVSVQHDVQSWSAVLLWQPVSFGNHAPLVGLGAGRINFNFTDHYDIRGAYSYPLFMVGWSLLKPVIDLFLSLPIGEVSTSFGYETYIISPAGPTATLMISL